jgi:hypothetical protein
MGMLRSSSATASALFEILPPIAIATCPKQHCSSYREAILNPLSKKFSRLCVAANFGTSGKLPSALPKGGSGILAPKGIYVIVMMPYLITQAQSAATSLGVTSDAALTNYFTLLLNNPAVSGLLLTAPLRTLNPNDPTPTSSPYSWNSIDDAFTAIDNWNGSNPTLPPKTLQLVVNPGFNSPNWIFNHLDSCDGLFLNPHPAKLPSSSRGYTDIFLETEGALRPRSRFDADGRPHRGRHQQSRKPLDRKRETAVGLHHRGPCPLARQYRGLRPMLGGSQFNKSFSLPKNMALEDCPMGTRLGTCSLSTTPPAPGCVVGTIHFTMCVAMPSPEQALFNILQVYFAGTMPGAATCDSRPRT